MWGPIDIHSNNIIHKDYHSGSIFIKSEMNAVTGVFGISKSAIDDDDNEIYGIISDIYSFGMDMRELITGRRPFWDKIHDTNLVIEICDGLRPSIVTNAPEGYIDLMKECWHLIQIKGPTAIELK
ncbi:kinase-like domain-containing protein [Glomus cerebriforme]|uniref:Kinase-like domain-containing protein n=1 Tax=Glomus cerebriforme TaxID=658196 RepID=A0A397SRU9_9GLOM|nr:kinase-like domain-containing protein [Glomus cerebriforme]